MDSYTEEQRSAPTQQPPSFLKNLCILTFIWAGASILISLAQIPGLYENSTDNPQMQASLEQLQASNPDLSEVFKKIIVEIDKHKRTNWIFTFVGNCFSLMGALMMWHLQKRGFYIYAAAEILPTILSILFSGFTEIIQTVGLTGAFITGVIIVSVVFVFIVDIVFIAMYGSQLKHMH